VAPSITTQPASQTVTAGQTASFSVAATGTAPLSYQWKKNSTTISGATSSSYTTPATTTSDNGAQFTVVVSNVAGSLTSNVATLTVNPGPPPGVPTGLTASAVSSSQINLSWNASTGSVAGYNVYRSGTKISTSTTTSYQDTGLSPSTTYTYTVSAFDAAGNTSAQSVGALATTQGTSSASYGLEWPGDGAVRRMLYWHNPFPIYDATYIFKVYPRKKIVPSNSPTGYYTTFFWGNDGTFTWDGGSANTYYGAHPYPIPPPNGPGQWEISVYGADYVTGSEVQWDRWYTQAFRGWRESPAITHYEFYYDLPDTSKVITQTINDPGWANKNPPTPAIVMGQTPDLNGASWGGYPGWEEFNGIIRGIQIYSGLLSLAEIQSEIAAPKSTPNGWNFIWYLNTDPRPSDVTDKKSIGPPHNPSWSGTTAFEWIGQAPPTGSPSKAARMWKLGVQTLEAQPCNFLRTMKTVRAG
jgi:hypothetical protein